MKKLFVLLSLLSLVLVGCGDASAKNTCPAPTVYTFQGEGAQFTLTEGRISLNDGTPCNEKETLDGGLVAPKDTARFTDLTTIHATLYLTEGDERHTLVTTERTHDDGGTVDATCRLSSISGSGSLLGTKLIDGEDLEGHLFCEVRATRTDGTTETDTIPLTLQRAS